MKSGKKEEAASFLGRWVLTGISEGSSGCKQKTQRIEEGGDKGCDLGPGVAWTRAVAGEREEGMGRVKSQQIKTHGLMMDPQECHVPSPGRHSPSSPFSNSPLHSPCRIHEQTPQEKSAKGFSSPSELSPDPGLGPRQNPDQPTEAIPSNPPHLSLGQPLFFSSGLNPQLTPPNPEHLQLETPHALNSSVLPKPSPF